MKKTLLLSIAIIITWPAFSFASPLGTAKSIVRSYVTLVDGNYYNGDGQNTSLSSNSFEYLGINYSGNSTAQTLNIGQNTYANAETAINIDSCNGNCGTGNINGNAASGFAYRTALELKDLANDPFSTNSICQIPVKITGSLTVNANVVKADSLSDNASANAQLTITDLSALTPYPAVGKGAGYSGSVKKVFISSSKTYTAGQSSSPTVVPINETIMLDLDHFLEISLSANTSASIWGLVGTSATAMASADPVFSFDQKAFDLTMGENTFVLSDYFSFAYSEQTYAVPIPGAIWLLGSGILGLAGIRRQKV